MRLIERNWEKLFNDYDILSHIQRDGFYTITSALINKVHEARLMTKFDHKANLPDIFTRNKISILPITRGSYILGHFDAYQDITYADVKNIRVSLPAHIESINYSNLYSESACLHCAYVSGIINDIAEEATLPTVSGRMSAGSFSFNIRNVLKGNLYPVTVENSQLEIDGGYESAHKLIIIEAKNFTADDFLIRQLYYPYRLWKSRLAKDVIPVFMTYSNDVFSFFIYRFNALNEYNSLELVQQRNYIIDPEQITLDDIYQVLQTVQVAPEPEIPFPQANSMVRIVDLLSILMEHGELSADYITQNYAFTERQTAYYTTAAIYLGLVRKRRDGAVYYTLSEEGRRVMGLRHRQKVLGIVEAILKHEVFNMALREYFATFSLTRDRIVDIMKQCTIYHVNSQDTIERRAHSVLKWIEWVLALAD